MLVLPFAEEKMNQGSKTSKDFTTLFFAVLAFVNLLGNLCVARYRGFIYYLTSDNYMVECIASYYVYGYFQVSKNHNEGCKCQNLAFIF
jgi:ribonucleotide reductase alpha subunit